MTSSRVRVAWYEVGASTFLYSSTMQIPQPRQLPRPRAGLDYVPCVNSAGHRFRAIGALRRGPIQAQPTTINRRQDGEYQVWYEVRGGADFTCPPNTNMLTAWLRVGRTLGPCTAFTKASSPSQSHAIRWKTCGCDRFNGGEGPMLETCIDIARNIRILVLVNVEVHWWLVVWFRGVHGCGLTLKVSKPGTRVSPPQSSLRCATRMSQPFPSPW